MLESAARKTLALLLLACILRGSSAAEGTNGTSAPVAASTWWLSTLDANKDGTASKSEIMQYLEQQGLALTEETVDSILALRDTNGDGLDAKEIINIFARLVGSFKVLDRNSDLALSADELQAAVEESSYSLTADETQKIISSLDRNKNGVIEFGEIPGSRPEVELFATFDVDQNGVLSTQEFLDAFSSRGVSKNVSSYLLESIDSNEDDKVSFEEVANFFELLLDEYFDGVDEDGSHALSLEEIEDAFEQSGVNFSEEEVLNIVRFFDINKDGEIDPLDMPVYGRDKALFITTDTDGDRLLSPKEVAETFRQLGVSDEETIQGMVDFLIEISDTNADNKIDFYEYLSGWKSVLGLFADLDSFNDGTLTVEEFMASFEAGIPISKEDAAALMKLYDQNGDGVWNSSELSGRWLE